MCASSKPGHDQAAAGVDGLAGVPADLAAADGDDPSAVDRDGRGARGAEDGAVEDGKVGHARIVRGRTGCGRRVRYDQPVIELRSTAEIEAMRPAGRFVAEVLTELAARVAAGRQPPRPRPQSPTR